VAAAGAFAFLLAALALTRALGAGFWATNLVLGPVIVGLPLLLAREQDLGLRLRAGPRGWRGTLGVAAGLALLTLPAWVLLRGTSVRLALLPMQTLGVALPEEFFFRGYLQGQWARAPGRRTVRLLGATVGWEWPATAAAFAIAHVVGYGPAGLLRFFPGLLFGWAYARTGSIWAGVLYHGACNVVS